MNEPDEDTCRAYGVDGEPVVLRGAGPLDDEDQAALAEIVRAAKRHHERVTTERCERTELLVVDCAHCRGNDQTPDEQVATERRQTRARLVGDPRWFPAQYPGKCERCAERFTVGDLIRMDPGRGWIADCCGTEP